MGWLTRMIRRSNERFDVDFRDAGAEVRSQILADSMAAARKPREPVGAPLVLWRFDGANWDRWSVLGLTYDDVDEHHHVPGTLLEHVADLVPPLTEGDRFRLDDGSWTRLGADDPDGPAPEADTVDQVDDVEARLIDQIVSPTVPPPLPGSGDDNVPPPFPASEPTPVEPEPVSVAEQLEAWRNRQR